MALSLPRGISFFVRYFVFFEQENTASCSAAETPPGSGASPFSALQHLSQLISNFLDFESDHHLNTSCTCSDHRLRAGSFQHFIIDHT